MAEKVLSTSVVRELPPVNYMIQKSKRSRPFIAHVDKLNLYEGENLPKSWLTDVDDGQTGDVDGVGVHSRGDGLDDNGAGNVGETGAESGINGLPDDVVANALPAGVATIDEINNWSGSGTSSGSQHRVTVFIRRLGWLARSTGPRRRTTGLPWSRLRVSTRIPWERAE